nr:MAG TPA: hypothetical protein [Caudoviricetes sp.]
MSLVRVQQKAPDRPSVIYGSEGKYWKVANRQ